MCYRSLDFWVKYNTIHSFLQCCPLFLWVIFRYANDSMDFLSFLCQLFEQFFQSQTKPQLFSVLSLVMELTTRSLLTSGSSEEITLNSTSGLDHSSSGLERNLGPWIHILLARKSSTFIPLNASSAGFSLEPIYLHCSTSLASLMTAATKNHHNIR